MGWSNCGEDSAGRPIGYAFEATCDHQGCNSKINRGLSYACGDMHGETELGCERYFCEEHRHIAVEDGDRCISVCNGCAKELIESEEWLGCSEDCVLKRINDI
ncbi:hypothetical protein N473_26255 [Pseudoalteromonas luteoviolacea CPMOR-1]|uniref:Uncharacterized protein n=1 Tax=Pseudoalteromonas luteoviolacea CPMOR-1 TaxID=1365248 RepID=A0A167I5G0_9GAMM|nr:hypothetical protein [Pseudoalteromonas luteoviolacea]KZN58922.1 hypothetical protein N473_26255 [Pseudoalteromonas luteoviolacea CPMOR-1]